MKEQAHVLGAGGIGVTLAWSLARAGWDVTVIDANPRKVESGRKEGLTVVNFGTERPAFISFDEWAPSENAFTLLCTKTYDNPAVLGRLRNFDRLIPVQNGFDPELDRKGHPGEGIASYVSECERDRPVTRITRAGCLHFGPRRAVTPAELAQLDSVGASILKGGLFPVEFVENTQPFKAAKLMYNAAISPLAGAAGVDNGELLTDPLAKRLFFALLQENYAILKNAGVSLAKIGPFHPDTVARILRTPLLPSVMAMFFRPSLRGTYCSMAPDMVTGRTEIEAYNGHLIRLAGTLPCPLNRAAHALIREIVENRVKPAREHLRRLEGVLQESQSC